MRQVMNATRWGRSVGVTPAVEGGGITLDLDRVATVTLTPFEVRVLIRMLRGQESLEAIRIETELGAR